MKGGAIFNQVVNNTYCPFAENATWQETASNPCLSTAQQISDSANTLRSLIPAAEADGRDMVVLRVDRPEAVHDLRLFTSFVNRLLSLVSDDPRSMGDDTVMLRQGWRYWVGDVECFVLTFAPLYRSNHPRHSPNHSAYIVFQFESSFERNAVTTMSPEQLRKLSSTVRARFEEHGVHYFAEVTHGAPESLHVIKPRFIGDEPIKWWQFSDPTLNLGPTMDSAYMSHLDALDTHGNVVFDRVLPDRVWFKQVYDLYDELYDWLTDETGTELRQAALDWLNVGDNDSYYCGAPCGFRDRKSMQFKRDKAYMQWCLEFARSTQFAETAAGQLPAMQNLSHHMEHLESVCSELFMRVLTDIGEENPDYVARYDMDRPLPIIIKLIRYNKNPTQFATDPHYDKSALSLILNADDDEVRWRLGRGDNCPLSKMTAPFSYPDSPDEPNSCVMFTGLCLERSGVRLAPTPHFVMPVEDNKFRHAVIAFLLTPHLENTDSLNTQAPYIHDVMQDIR